MSPQPSLDSVIFTTVIFGSVPYTSCNALPQLVFWNVLSSFVWKNLFSSPALLSSPARRTHILLIDTTLLLAGKLHPVSNDPLLWLQDIQFLQVFLLTKFGYWPLVSHRCVWLSASVLSIIFAKISWLCMSEHTCEFLFCSFDLFFCFFAIIKFFDYSYPIVYLKFWKTHTHSLFAVIGEFNFSLHFLPFIPLFPTPLFYSSIILLVMVTFYDCAV